MCRIRSYSKSVSEVLRWGNQTHCLTSERCKICNPKPFILQIWCWHTKRMTKHSIIMWWVQMEKGGVCWKSLAAPCWLNEKPSDQAIQRLHVSKPCQKERKLLQSAKLLHEKQLRTHLATQNLEFFRKNPWRCPANSARKHFADLTSKSDRETQHLWAKNSSANDGKFPEVEKYKFVIYDLNKKTSCQSLSKSSIVSLLFRCQKTNHFKVISGVSVQKMNHLQTYQWLFFRCFAPPISAVRLECL